MAIGSIFPTVTIAGIEAASPAPSGSLRPRRLKNLRRWLSAVEHFYAGRILPLVVEEARHAGLIPDRARAYDPGFDDVAIAATAKGALSSG
jgi:hypothetical protein